MASGVSLFLSKESVQRRVSLAFAIWPSVSVSFSLSKMTPQSHLKTILEVSYSKKVSEVKVYFLDERAHSE